MYNKNDFEAYEQSGDCYSCERFFETIHGLQSYLRIHKPCDMVLCIDCALNHICKKQNTNNDNKLMEINNYGL